MTSDAVLSVLLALGIGETIKILVSLARKEPIIIFGMGGMPSTHSAAVAALFLSVYYETGTSLYLLITAVFGTIVIRDAYGLRWEVSKHSFALNRLLRKEEFFRVGHQKLEVLAGIALGLIVAYAVYA
jgi:uncharacterized protein